MTQHKGNTTPNSTYKKLAVQWLNTTLCPPLADSVQGASFVIRNPPLRQAPNRYPLF